MSFIVIMLILFGLLLLFSALEDKSITAYALEFV
jgi:hypothetical protein